LISAEIPSLNGKWSSAKAIPGIVQLINNQVIKNMRRGGGYALPVKNK